MSNVTPTLSCPSMPCGGRSSSPWSSGSSSSMSSFLQVIHLYIICITSIHRIYKLLWSRGRRARAKVLHTHKPKGRGGDCFPLSLSRGYQERERREKEWVDIYPRRWIRVAPGVIFWKSNGFHEGVETSRGSSAHRSMSRGLGEDVDDVCWWRGCPGLLRRSSVIYLYVQLCYSHFVVYTL